MNPLIRTIAVAAAFAAPLAAQAQPASRSRAPKFMPKWLH